MNELEWVNNLLPWLLKLTAKLRQGLLMREKKSVHATNKGAFWATSMLFSLVQELVPFWDVERDSLDGAQISIPCVLPRTYAAE